MLAYVVYGIYAVTGVIGQNCFVAGIEAEDRKLVQERCDEVLLSRGYSFQKL